MERRTYRHLHTNFDEAMGKGTGYFRQIENYTGRNRQHFRFFRELYQKNNFLNSEPREEPRIPKILHQIWIGPREIPEELCRFQKTWLDLHPDWEYCLWTNDSVQELEFTDPILKELFDRPLTLGERTDILRYEILYQFGGVYSDLDCECLRPLDPLVESFDFFGGIFHPMFATTNRAIFLNNCLLGAKPHHPVIAKISSIMRENWDNLDHAGDEFYTTIQRTLAVLTEATIREAGQDGHRDVALPPTYLFPVVPYPLLDKMIRGPIDSLLGIFNPKKAPYSHAYDYSFALHHSHKEWMVDLYSTVTFNHEGWAAFSVRDWLRFLKSQFNRDTERKIARQTFEEFLAG